MTVTETPRTYLQLGDIVVDMASGIAAHRQRHGLSPERGVVVYARGKGINPGMHLIGTDSIIIKLSPGIHVHTSDRTCEYWQVIPREEQTTSERIASVLANWQPPEWLEDGDEINFIESFEGQLLLALLSPDQADSIFDGNWPEWDELWLYVARTIDEIKQIS